MNRVMNKVSLTLAALVGCACLALNGDTNLISSVRAALDVLRSQVNPRELRYGALNETLNFNDGLSQTPRASENVVPGNRNRRYWHCATPAAIRA